MNKINKIQHFSIRIEAKIVFSVVVTIITYIIMHLQQNKKLQVISS